MLFPILISFILLLIPLKGFGTSSPGKHDSCDKESFIRKTGNQTFDVDFLRKLMFCLTQCAGKDVCEPRDDQSVWIPWKCNRGMDIKVKKKRTRKGNFDIMLYFLTSLCVSLFVSLSNSLLFSLSQTVSHVSFFPLSFSSFVCLSLPSPEKITRGRKS